MQRFFQNDNAFFDNLVYFYKEYPNSYQGKLQQYPIAEKKEIFEQAVYCFLTPATKSNAADYTIQELLADDFFYRASLEELAACLRKPPYIRFHNQKAERLLLWQHNGMKHIENMLVLEHSHDQRQYLVNHVKGMNYKEATHFLRNIGRSGDLVILDRHIINFMKKVGLLSEQEDISKLSKNYLIWEKLFIEFINSDLWKFSFESVHIPRADFAIWAAGVKNADSHLDDKRILELR